ncbi:unnamed protein product [Blumeria hordei]|uniref:Uncharacterized protein n=1 Tax=Blumeria hordei TaxID=2867405 RepID=A0A383ULM5_BLUHO|nr:unnamed protein product [Blumeria hordei]
MPSTSFACSSSWASESSPHILQENLTILSTTGCFEGSVARQVNGSRGRWMFKS